MADGRCVFYTLGQYAVNIVELLLSKRVSVPHSIFDLEDIQNVKWKQNQHHIHNIAKNNSKLITFGKFTPKSPVIRVIEKIIIFCVDQATKEQVQISFQVENYQNCLVSTFDGEVFDDFSQFV